MQRSIDLLDVLAFTHVVETGTFARAAERMGISKSVLSRRVARLEERLGARLLTRTAQGAQPTEIGQAYFERASNILAELEAAQETVAQAVTQIAGPLRISAPVNFGTAYLAPALADFAKAHPLIELDVSLDDRKVDIVGGGFDLALRIGQLADSALVARRVTAIRAAVVASPFYLAEHGRPTHPRELNGHDLLVYTNISPSQQWRLRVGKSWETIRGPIRLRADNGDLLREAACAGLGIAVLPTFIASPAIEKGTLKVLLPDYPLEETALNIVMPPGRAVTARVRAMVDFLAARFGPEPAWDPCWPLTGVQERGMNAAIASNEPKETDVAKGQVRSNKEARKPKKEVKKTIAANPSTKGGSKG